MIEITFKGRHFQRDMILQSVRWYLAYGLSYRDIEDIMCERGFLKESVNLQAIGGSMKPILKLKDSRHTIKGRWIAMEKQ